MRETDLEKYSIATNTTFLLYISTHSLTHTTNDKPDNATVVSPAMSTTPPRLPQLQGLTPLRFSPYRRSGSSPRSKRLSNYRREGHRLPSHHKHDNSSSNGNSSSNKHGVASKTLAASTSMDSLASISSSVSADVIFQDLRKSEVNYLEELQLLIQSDLSPRMTSVVRKLKLLHDNMPTDGFFNWVSMTGG